MLPTNSGKNIPTKKVESDQTAFENLQLLLQFLGFDTLLMPVSNDNPVEQLIISSRNDEEEKGFMLRLMFANDFDYSDEGLFFHYTHAVKGRELDNKLVVELINMMTFFFEQFGRKLIEFATNDQKLPDAISEYEQSMGQVLNPNSK